MEPSILRADMRHFDSVISWDSSGSESRRAVTFLDCWLAETSIRTWQRLPGCRGRIWRATRRLRSLRGVTAAWQHDRSKAPGAWRSKRRVCRCPIVQFRSSAGVATRSMQIGAAWKMTGGCLARPSGRSGMRGSSAGSRAHAGKMA